MNSLLPHEPAPLAPGPLPVQAFAWVGDLSGFLRRNRVLLAATVAGAVLLGLIYLAMATPRFTASATLMIDLRQAAPDQQGPTVSDAQIENAMIESEIEVLRSPGLARTVVAALHLGDDRAFVGSPSPLSRSVSSLRAPFTSRTVASEPSTAAEDRLVRQFVGSVGVHRIGLTYIIEIDATARTPGLAARLANGLATAYVNEQLSVRDAATRQASTWQEARLARLQDRALKADQQVQLFKSRSGIVDTGHGLLSEQQLTELSSQLIAARGRTAAASARLDRIRQMTAAGSNPAMAVSDVLTSPVINGLRERYLADAAHVAQWSAQYGSDNGAATLLRKQMAQLQSEMGSEVRRIEQAAAGDLEVDRASERAIQAELNRLSTEAGSTDTARATLRSLQSAADTYRALYVSVLQHATQSAQDEAYPIADARVVTDARPPLDKSRPQTKLILAATIVLGLGLGFAIALVREVLDRRLRRPADVAASTGLTCLAALPILSTARRPDASLAQYAVDHPDTPFGLGLRRLKLRLQQQGESSRARVVGLVAPAAKAGTSTVAASLVQSLIASGQDAVLLVASGESQSRAQIQERIETLRQAHRVVVIDLPALDRPAEAHTLFADIGSLVLVLEAGGLDGATVLARLRAAGLSRRSIMGVVLNRVRDGDSCDPA